MIYIYFVVVVIEPPNEDDLEDLFSIHGYREYPTAFMAFPVLERFYYEHLSDKFGKK